LRPHHLPPHPHEELRAKRNGPGQAILHEAAGLGPVPSTHCRLLFARSSFHAPDEIYCCSGAGEKLAALSTANDARLSRCQLGAVAELCCTGAKGDEVHSWVLTPPGMNSTPGRGAAPAGAVTAAAAAEEVTKQRLSSGDDHSATAGAAPAAASQQKYPLAVVIHGGPQGAVLDSWSYRWNPQILAAAGFVVLCVNFHASTGYGATFREAVSKDWAGAAYDDIVAATEHACATLPYVDGERVAALGASFGGYMV
jgi:dipeptidyl aminopeptidase/acylaminoacyl peptidase